MVWIYSLVLEPSLGATRALRGVTEWFNVPVSKTGDPSRDPGVRIPPPLPYSLLAAGFLFYCFAFKMQKGFERMAETMKKAVSSLR